jgi:hypothetical protein
VKYVASSTAVVGRGEGQIFSGFDQHTSVLDKNYYLQIAGSFSVMAG